MNKTPRLLLHQNFDHKKGYQKQGFNASVIFLHPLCLLNNNDNKIDHINKTLALILQKIKTVPLWRATPPQSPLFSLSFYRA